ncbi:VENN motif pre-toxin domain-containing protein, partial [Acinetobacter baumannii]|nr:VENN motif pre-toxin domain-containing protein [Acinetobacter baumannii]
MTKSSINTQNITIRDEQGQQALTGKTAGQIKSEILTSVTTDTARENSGALQNNFDKDRVQSEINLQMDVTKNFDANRQEAKAEINKKIDDAKKENQSIIDKQKQGLDLSKQEQDQLKAYNNKVENYQRLGVLLDSISTGLSAPTSSGLGIATATLSLAASYKIGQYFKEQANNNANGQLTSGQEAAHILAHTILGAAVAAAGGNDALTAGLSAGGAEGAAPILSSFLYGKDAKDLTADQKSAISSIVGLAGSAVGATTGDIVSTVQSGQVAQNAVENNYLTKIQILKFNKEMVDCKKNNNCEQVEKKYKDLSIEQQAVLAAVCSMDAVLCKEKYGFIVTSRNDIKKVLDQANNLPAIYSQGLLKQQIDAEGMVWNTELARQFKEKLNLTDEQATYLVSVASGIGIGGKIGKGKVSANVDKRLPVSTSTVANN